MRGLTLSDPGFVAATAGFSPLSLSPALWLDASDTSTITASSGSVSAWRDKSENARHMSQGTSTRQPKTGFSIRNGLNVIDFDGGDYLAAAAFQAVNASDGSWTCFAVSQPTINSSTSKQVLCSDNGSTSRIAQFSKWVSLNPRSTAFRNGGTSADAGPSTGALAWTYASSVCSTTEINVYTNGVSDGSGSVSTSLVTSSGAVGVGANQYNSEYFTGSIAEIILYSLALDATNRQLVELYLAVKWGL